MTPVATAETFWTIMSMLTSARATASNRRAAEPGTSGTPMTVILASERSWATPAMMGSSMVSPSVSPTTHVPSSPEKDERT